LSHGGHIVPEGKKALFYHAESRSQNLGGEAKRGKTKLFLSPGTIWHSVTEAHYTCEIVKKIAIEYSIKILEIIFKNLNLDMHN